MKKITLIICMLFIGLVSMTPKAVAQGIKDMRINEIMVRNLNGLEDSHGDNSGWVELYNTGYSIANLSGAFIQGTINGKTLSYRIPSSANAVVPPQSFIVFFANGLFHESFFNTNFSLYDSTATKGSVALYDASAKGDPITFLEYDMASQRDNVSMGWHPSEDGETEVWKALDYSTPGSINNVVDVEPKHVRVKRVDNLGLGISVTAMSVVLLALFLLYMIFRTIGKVMIRRDAKKKAIKSGNTPEVVAKTDTALLTGEAIAAISVALAKYSAELQDIESTVLTINKVARAYSPWSSKLYGMTQMPNKISNKR